MCTFNGEKYVEAQINSILDQSRVPDEIVICDDGSTDNTINIIQKLSEVSVIPIRLFINKDTLGVTRNFESAILQCSGDVIFLSDQDDVWYKDKILKMTASFERDKNVGMVYCDAVVTDAELSPTGFSVFETRGKSRVELGMLREPYELLYKPNIKGCTMAVSGTYARLALPITEFSNKPVWSHDYWLAAILSAVSKVEVFEESLMFYRIHGGNASGLLQFGRSKSNVKYPRTKTGWRIELYKMFIERLNSLFNQNRSIVMPQIKIYLSVLEKELELLKERKSIFTEQNLWIRIIKVFRFLFSGKYFRFKSWFRQVVRDIIIVEKP